MLAKWNVSHNPLSLRFNGLFPGEPGLAGVYWLRWWCQLDYWSLKSLKTPVKIVNKPTSSFLQAGCPSCRPTNNVKAPKVKYHIPWNCVPQANSSLLPWGGLPCLSSAIWCQYLMNQHCCCCCTVNVHLWCWLAEVNLAIKPVCLRCLINVQN